MLPCRVLLQLGWKPNFLLQVKLISSDMCEIDVDTCPTLGFFLVNSLTDRRLAGKVLPRLDSADSYQSCYEAQADAENR